jgi:hypothetical protein
MKPALCGTVLILLVAAPASFAHQKGKDVVKSTRVIRATLVGFEIGDYIHAILVTRPKGKEASYFIGAAGLDYYLAAFAKKPGTFTIQTVDSYVEEAGGRMTIERVSAAKIGKQDFKTWWKAQRKKYSDKQLDTKYQPMMDKLTRRG